MAFSKEHHYFKVDSRILELEKEALTKKELLVYLLHCRRVNPTKNQGCSFAGAKSAKKCFNLDKEAYEKAMKLLEEKHLIKFRNELKTGVLDTIAVEVLTFPKYIPSILGEVFTLDATRQDEHRRRYKGIRFIQIPSILIDNGYLIGLSVQAIYALLWLYSELKLSEYWGVNFNFIHTANEDGFKEYKNFGRGFSKIIFEKKCVKLEESRRLYQVSKDTVEKFQGDIYKAVNELINRCLVYSSPIIIEMDREDPDIKTIKREVFKGMVDFQKDETCLNSYLTLIPDTNEKVIWIFRVAFLPETPELEVYNDFIAQHKKLQMKIYSDYDITTNPSETKKLIDSDFFYWLTQNYEGLLENNSKIGEAFNKVMESDDAIEEMEYIENLITSKKTLIDNEKEEIEKLNKKNNTRKKTSALLKQLKRELLELEDKENELESQAESRDFYKDIIIREISDRVIEHYYKYCNL